MKKELIDFYREVGAKYPEEELIKKTLRGMVRYRFILSIIQNLKGPLLDIGCNSGLYLSEYTGGMSCGIDISVDLLKKAWKRDKKGSTYFFISGDAEMLDFIRPDTFENVLCSEVLEHLEEPEKVLESVYKILKPGGRLIISVPNYRKTKPEYLSCGPLAEYGVAPLENGKYRHTAFREDELRKIVEVSGFDVLESGTCEKEVKYSTRIPVVFYYIVRGINGIVFRSRLLENWNKRFMDSSAKLIYLLFRSIKLDPILQKLVSEGVRTYLIAEKKKD